MIDAIRAEWIKLRTVTIHWVIGIIAVAFPFIVTVLTAYFRGDGSDFSTGGLMEVLVGTTTFGSLLMSVLAATAVTSEFGSNTIRPTLAAIPRRGRVVASKALVITVLAVVLQALTLTVTWFVASAVANGRGSDVALSRAPLGYAPLAGEVVLAGLLALTGLGVGLLLRSTTGAVAALVLWPLLVESLLGGLLGLITDNEQIVSWMPYRAGFQLTSLDEFHFEGPSRVGGGLLFAGFALLVTALGTWQFHRRDA